jgi:integrase
MKTKHAPFSLYKKKVGIHYYWYIRFWDERKRGYAVHRATGVEAAGKKGRRSEAEKVANDLLPEVCFSVTNMNMIQYLKKFWAADSIYFRESERVYGRKLSAYYAKSHNDTIKLHIEKYPPFGGMGIDQLTAGIVRDFMLFLAERGVSGSRINRVLQTIRVPLHYAIERDEAKLDPFTKVKAAHEEHQEKGVLTREEVFSLIKSPIPSPKKRLAVLLGTLCGMRLGEVRGLHWEDIDVDKGLIHIRHNWQDLEGVKEPKWGSSRDVPLPSAIKLVGQSYQCSLKKPFKGLVFRRSDNKPPCNGYFRLALIAELEAIGIRGPWKETGDPPEGHMNDQRSRNITFHSLRHTFVSLSRLAGINDFQVQAMAGHKSAKMMERYSHAAQVVEMESCRNALEEFIEKSEKNS